MAKAKKTAGRTTSSTKVSPARKPSDASSATAASVRAELAKLGKTALQAKYKEVFGKPAKSDNVHHLRTALAKKLVPAAPAAAATEGGAAPKAPRPVKDRDPRLPAVGTVIKRPYKDVTHEVKVLADTFEYGGECHRSLSAISKLITGQQTNGFLWFGLIPREDKPAAGEKKKSDAAKAAPAAAPKRSGAKKSSKKKAKA